MLTKRFESAVLFQNGAVGDFLMSMFLAELLQKSGYVDQITIVVPRNLNFLQGLLGEYHYISAAEVSRRRGWSQLLQRMRRPCLVVLQPTLGKIPVTVKILAWSISRSYGSELIGFQDNGRLCKILYSKTLVYNTNRLYSENIQEIVRALGGPVVVEIPDLKLTPSVEYIQAYGLQHRPYVVFHPGAAVPKRSFTVQAAREVIEHVLKRNPDMHVVLSGGPTERRLIDEIRIGIQKKERLVNAIGCSAKEIAAFIQSAQFFLGTDSGITHLACFLRARVIVAAHCGTVNWLPFYCPSATVLYRLQEEQGVHESRDYLDKQRRGRVKPLGQVPAHAVCDVLDEFLAPRSKLNNAMERISDSFDHLTSCDKVSSMKIPAVSVVMPVYNAAATLDEAVRSILDQTWRDFEFIIVDDGSTDGTTSKLERYQKLDSRVRVCRQEKEGVIAALNRGCRLARGVYIARMDADDISLPRRIERQREFLEGRPEVGIVGTWASRMDENGSIIGKACPSPNPRVLKWEHFFGVCVIHPTVLMRREILEKLEFYRADAVHAEDRDLWLRASAITEFSNVPEILFKYRVWRNSTSKRLRLEYLENAIELVAFFISDFLKENPSMEAVAGLRGMRLASLNETLLTAALLERLYNTFVSRNVLSSEELKEISWHAAKKMGCLALQASRFSKLEFLYLLKRALQLNYRILSPSAILKGLEHRRLWNFAR